MHNDFQALLLEGVFYLGEDALPDSHGETREGFKRLWVSTNEGVLLDVFEQLQPFIGQKVQFTVHHVPLNPPDPTLWGAGCCLWQRAGVCMYGHHNNPTDLYSQSGQGTLTFDLDHTKSEGGWWLDPLDGTREPLFLWHALPGHRARVAAATLFDVEDAKEKIASGGGFKQADALGVKANELRDLVERLSKATRG